MKFREPVRQGDDVVMGEGGDGLFDLLEFGHGGEYSKVLGEIHWVGWEVYFTAGSPLIRRFAPPSPARGLLQNSVDVIP